MSGGTPVAIGGFMRQRHSQGYTSSGDDLEDDACSKPAPSSVIHRVQTWTQVLENALWIASAAFIIYFGDWKSNMVYVLCHDNRIKRVPLYLGVATFLLNVGFIFCTALSARRSKKSYKKSELLPSAAPTVALVGFLSFSLLTFALWPIWSFLTLPLLFTLFMAFLVISTYVPLVPLEPQALVLRADRILPMGAKEKVWSLEEHIWCAHQATIVWFHGLGDHGSSWSQLLETLSHPNIKWICPTAPTRPVAVFSGFPCTAWDISEEGPDDAEGIDATAAHVANLLSTEPGRGQCVVPDICDSLVTDIS